MTNPYRQYADRIQVLVERLSMEHMDAPKDESLDSNEVAFGSPIAASGNSLYQEELEAQVEEMFEKTLDQNDPETLL